MLKDGWGLSIAGLSASIRRMSNLIENDIQTDREQSTSIIEVIISNAITVTNSALEPKISGPRIDQLNSF